MDYKRKYFKYKAKYFKLRDQIGGSSVSTELNENEKELLSNIISTTVYQNSRDVIIRNTFLLLKYLYKIYEIYKIDMIICIGDSPTIFIHAYKKLCDHYGKKTNIKYLPISNLKNTPKNILKKKLELLNKKIKGKILWIDYINSGLGFLNFYNSLPTKINNNSIFFLYGSILKEKPAINDLFMKLNNKNKLFYYQVNSTSLFDTLIMSVIGDSEKMNLRCIEYSSINKDYDIILYDSLPSPLLNDHVNKNCNLFANIIFKFFIKYDFNIFK